jgi:hypothetical protein
MFARVQAFYQKKGIFSKLSFLMYLFIYFVARLTTQYKAHSTHIQGPAEKPDDF